MRFGRAALVRSILTNFNGARGPKVKHPMQNGPRLGARGRNASLNFRSWLYDQATLGLVLYLCTSAIAADLPGPWQVKQDSPNEASALARVS